MKPIYIIVTVANPRQSTYQLLTRLNDPATILFPVVTTQTKLIEKISATVFALTKCPIENNNFKLVADSENESIYHVHYASQKNLLAALFQSKKQKNNKDKMACVFRNIEDIQKVDPKRFQTYQPWLATLKKELVQPPKLAHKPNLLHARSAKWAPTSNEKKPSNRNKTPPRAVSRGYAFGLKDISPTATKQTKYHEKTLAIDPTNPLLVKKNGEVISPGKRTYAGLLELDGIVAYGVTNPDPTTQPGLCEAVKQSGKAKRVLVYGDEVQDKLVSENKPPVTAATEKKAEQENDYLTEILAVAQQTAQKIQEQIFFRHTLTLVKADLVRVKKEKIKNGNRRLKSQNSFFGAPAKYIEFGRNIKSCGT
ncbi:MAG: hypothetical protein ACK4PR_12775 [Gammaproteobacteria bacterium]